MADRININRGWTFCPEDIPGAEQVAFDDGGWKHITLPHTHTLLPHHHFSDAAYQFVSWYRTRMVIPADAENKRLFLDFDGIMTASEVYVNGEKLEEHKGGYTPFTVELTGKVTPGSEAVMAVHVDATERPDIPPFGGVVDYLTFGGIYRDIFLRISSSSYISDLFVYAEDVLTAPVLCATVEVEQADDRMCLVLSLEDEVGHEVTVMTTPVHGKLCEMRSDVLSDIKLWSLDNPTLYRINVRLYNSNGTLLDTCAVRFGFREAHFCDDGAFRLNGEVVKLIGLNRHQSYPYIGYAAPARLQRQDADVLKHQLSLNIVRTSHYPQSPYFLDRCDEIGLLVFEEIPGWQHIGDLAWQEQSKRDLRAMILRDRNHPSIIMWGVRINESGNSYDFYAATNRIAHELDPTRQTGGVRYQREVDFQEDVYTFNDFSGAVLDPNHQPYLITEFNGHLFPTKSWDNEERKVEHALRHAKIQSQQMLDPRIAGAIGWCAFDYNTHAAFGSGDRICYHGVCDIFRLPKWAAHVYASQIDPAQRVVLEVVSHWTMGDRSAGGVEPLVICSNCAFVKLYVGATFYGEYYPAVKDYPGLPHPPFIVHGLQALWGAQWHDLRVEGFIGMEKVAEVRRDCDPLPASLKVWTDSDTLVCDGQDMTAVYFQIVDRYGHVCPFASNVVTAALDGPAQLIGVNPFAPQGGQGALYVKAGELPGLASLTLQAVGLAPVTLEIRLVE